MPERDPTGAASTLAVESSVPAPMREFLVWVAFHPRTEADVMQAWQSHCPRFTVWEDAQAMCLIVIEATDGPLGSATVRLTPLGQATLARAALETRQPA